MKVREFIELLRTLDPEAVVCTRPADGHVEDSHVEPFEVSEKFPLRVTYAAVFGPFDASRDFPEPFEGSFPVVVIE